MIRLTRITRGHFVPQFTRTYAKSNKPTPYTAELKKLNKSTPRSVKIFNQKQLSVSKITEIDENFQIFDKSIKRVVDLGSSPGLWSQYAKNRIFSINKLQEAGFRNEGFVIGVDIVNTVPPLGITTIQGNIFSDHVRTRLVTQCKELSYRIQNYSTQSLAETKPDDESYYTREQKEGEAHEEALSEKFESINYKVDLLLSDLTLTLPQETGFWNNTMTKPYLRIATNPSLQLKATNSKKNALDLGDATLIYAIDILRENGTMLLRLNGIDLLDPELHLFELRLKNVFKLVEKMEGTDTFIGSELFYICKGKNDSIDKVSAFTVNRKLKAKL